MRSGNIHNDNEGVNRAARKKLLELACACDRIEFAVAWRKTTRPAKTTASLLASNPWTEIAITALAPFLPRKLRLLGAVFKLWQARKEHAVTA